MSIDPTSYDPNYISLDDLPLAGPDDYTETQKRKASFEAETRMESDVNGGLQIDDQELTKTHVAAVLQYATYRLASSAEEPSDVTLGDVQDDGGQAGDYAEQYLDAYKELVEALNDSGGGGNEAVYYGAHGDGRSVAVNTRDELIKYDYPFDETERFPE